MGPHQFKFVKERDKVLMHFKEWPLKSTIYQVVDVTSLAAAYHNEPEPIQQVAEKGRQVFEAVGRRSKEMARWRENDRGPDKMV